MKHTKVSEVTQKLEKQYGPFVLHTAAALSAIQRDNNVQVNGSDKGHYDGMPLLHSGAGDKVLYIPYLGVM